ncbi:hypothetical protein ACFWIJ_17290, partial [Streptomyces sp. NPDC127079]
MREQYRTDSAVAPPAAHRPPPIQPADARRAVRGEVARHAVPHGVTGLEDALLVTSELATNAILHGGGITGVSRARARGRGRGGGAAARAGGGGPPGGAGRAPSPMPAARSCARS